jgi:UDP-glucose 4-epimerase
VTRILVTGGHGFIGSHLVDGLAAAGHRDVTILGRRRRPGRSKFILDDLSDAGRVRRALASRRFEVVYHAAWSTIHETSLEDIALDVEANLKTTVNLLEACRATGVRRVIFLSSGGTVYGLPRTSPVREDHPTDPISAYGITKLAAEKYLELYRHLYGLDYVIFRPSVPYGPGQNPLKRQGAVSVFTYRALRGEPITIWGDGSAVRDFFYVGDMIQPLVRALDAPIKGPRIFNLAGRRGYTLLQLVKVLGSTLNLEPRIDFKPARAFDVPTVRLDIGAATRAFRWTESTPLAEGIRRTADWQRAWMRGR